MKKKIVAFFVCASVLLCHSICYAESIDYDSINPSELSYDELLSTYLQLKADYDALKSSETIETTDSSAESYDPSLTTDIVFEETKPFFGSNKNYDIIMDNINALKIEELKTAVGLYIESHPDEGVLSSVLNALQEYGDFENLVCDIDDFSGKKTIHYIGYTGIDETHYIYPYTNGGDYNLQLGFVRDDWLFAEDMMLKRASEDISDGIWFRGDGFDFERDTLDGGMIREYKEEWLYDSDVDYLLEDMSEEMVIRFEADNGDHFDYTLSDEDKAALQAVAKFVKLKDVIASFKY